ncbi:MAG: tetratricopeptide repeat protein [Solirubrobacteraceae bacterium]
MVRSATTNVDTFLGRREEIAAVVALLDGARLVTLTGAPGIGKSRLAVEVAGEQSDDVTLVELAPIGDRALVPAAVAAALSVQEVPGEPLTETIVAGLRGRPHLIVLDNCEHLLAACRELVDALLERCPQLSVLATSREPLATYREIVWPVPPLSFPEQSELAEAERLMGYEAVRLFVERAGAVEPGFALNDYIAPHVVDVCRRLDGIPLAIELAAAQAALLTPSEIARRLDDRFGLLTDAGAGGPARHETLEAALDWSYELLREPERVVLGRLSVFAGGFDLLAAASVCEGMPVAARSVRELVERLVSKSLVAVDAETGRYGLLETIRAYAGERLEQSGDARAVREAHARFYVALAEAAEPELTGPAQPEWFERLEAERANVRSALEWSVGHGRGEWALRLSGALVLFWVVRCHFTEGRELLVAALAAGDGAPPGLTAKARWGEGFLMLMAGDSQSAVALLCESLEDFRGLGDTLGAARALLLLANCGQADDNPTPLALLQESAELARVAGDSWCLANALGVAGLEHCFRDELDAARPRFEECLAVARAARDRQGLRMGLLGLGLVALRQGNYRAAEPLLEECVTVTEELGEVYAKGTALRYLGDVAFARGAYGRAGELFDASIALLRRSRPGDLIPALVMSAKVAWAEERQPEARILLAEALTLARGGAESPAGALQGMAEVAMEDGDRALACRLFEEAIEGARAVGDVSGAAAALFGLGVLARAEGKAKRAAVLHSEALGLRRQIAIRPAIGASLEALAGLAADATRYEQAARLMGAAQNALEENGYARAPWESARYDNDLALAREGLSDEAFATAYAQGACMSLDDAAAQATIGPRPARASSGWPSLTVSEQHVAALVGQGLTNPEVACLLLVSVASVKAHLSSIFSKLDMTRRSELVLEVAQRERPPPTTNP